MEELGEGRNGPDPENLGEEWRGNREREQVEVEGGLLIVRDSRHGAAQVEGDGMGMAALWPQWEEEDAFTKNPPSRFYKIAKRSPASFSNLKEAFKHFYKFQKNSPRLHLSFRSFTKIGKVK